jgi:membrane protease YdiL (CAAX protease family)
MFFWLVPLVLTLELAAQWATPALALLTMWFVFLNVVRPVRSERRVAATLRLRPWRTYVGWLTLGAIAQIVVTLASLIIHEQLADWRLLPHPPDDPNPIPPSYFTNPLGPVAMLLAAAVLTPLIEEFGCRGRMQYRLERELGIVPAIVIPAVIFCLLHGLIVAAHHLIFALFVGWVVWRTGSIWTAVYVHMVNNTAAVAVMLLTHGSAEMTEIPARLWPYAVATGFLAAGLVWIAAWRIHLVAQRHRPRAGPLSHRRPVSSDLAPARG